MYPWDHHSAFERDRLVAIAQLIQRGRNDALDRFDPAKGCTGWTVGCEAFAFQRHQIIAAASEFEWLAIVDPSMQFVFSIGGVPVRFYRGEPNEPTSRTLKQSFPELAQTSLFSTEELERLGSQSLYRFAVETDTDGSLIAVSFVVLNGETPLLTWTVPLEQAVTKISPLWVEGSEGIQLPAPTVRVAGAEDTDEAADA